MIRFIIRRSPDCNCFWIEYVPTWKLGCSGKNANFFHIWREKIELTGNLAQIDRKQSNFYVIL